MSGRILPAAVEANARDPYNYALGNFPRRPIEGRVVAVLRPTRLDRGLALIAEKSRCIRAGEIHEAILTDESGAAPGGRVDRVAYLGFLEFTIGGVIVTGDRLMIGGQAVGVAVGYDVTHMPNHLNIVFVGDNFASGFDRGVALGDFFSISTTYVDSRGLSRGVR